MFWKRFWLVFFIISFLFFFYFFYFYFQEKSKNEIIFLDVGQGNSTLIKSRDGKNMLIDTGNEKKAIKSLVKEMGFFNRKLDIIFITHYDLDHIGLLPYYLKNYNVSLVVDTGIENVGESQKGIFNEIKKLIREKGIKYLSARAGNEFYLNNNLKIKIFFPGRFLDINKLKSNSSSMVLQVILDGKKYLITGDLPDKFEKVLVNRLGEELKSDVLLAGHHGSKTSSSEEFLKKVSPKKVVISVGADNSYGHPSKEILIRINDLGLEILRTDLLGSVSF